MILGKLIVLIVFFFVLNLFVNDWSNISYNNKFQIKRQPNEVNNY